MLGWVSLCNDVASEMIFPLLPQFLLTVLKGNLFSLGVIEGAVDSASSIVKLWSGGWSDRIGSRKGLVLFGYALAAVARPLVAIITAPWQLFAIRLGDRVGKGIRISARDALVPIPSLLKSVAGPSVSTVQWTTWEQPWVRSWPQCSSCSIRDKSDPVSAGRHPGLVVVLLLVLGLREPAKKGRCPKDDLDA